MPDDDRDVYLWAEFAREAMGRLMKDHDPYTSVTLAAKVADAMMDELRERFPAPEPDEKARGK